MTDDPLRKTLEDLRAEIARGRQTDPVVRARLEALMRAVELRLEHPDDDEQRETLTGGLREALQEFGAAHPRATALLNRVMTSLGEAGI